MHGFRYVLLILALVMGACGGPLHVMVHGNERVRGADGEVIVEELDGGNHLVTVQMQHLPPPDRLEGKYSRYAVWIIAHGQPAHYASQLDYDPDERIGRAQATTPHRKFDVAISAENEAQPGSPTLVVVRQPIVVEE